MERLRFTLTASSITALILSIAIAPMLATAAGPAAWPQWGQNPQHTGQSSAVGQSADRLLADVVYDPFVPAEQKATFGDLLAHYQAPLLDGNDVFMEVKTGAFTGSSTWNTQIWGENAFTWQDGQLTQKWAWASDWKPEPNTPAAVGSSPTERWGLNGWEPVFHAVMVGNFIYAPGAEGAIWKLNRQTGAVMKKIMPGLAGDLDPANTFVSGPLSADSGGNVYYNVLQLDPADPYGIDKSHDIPGSWLVKVSSDVATSVAYSTLVAGAPTTCDATFSLSQLPWPPTFDAVVPTGPCGTQRPGINVAPAIAPDGTIYTVSRAHFRTRYGYVIAVNPNLTPKWAASLRGHLSDGCNDGTQFSVLPPNGTPGGCIAGAHAGVDPATNTQPAGRVIDQSSSSPTVAPDGSVLYGAYSRYNFARGHMFKFSSTGAFLAAYDFGWDTTPAILSHSDGSYSVVEKDNHYDAGSYCNDNKVCPVAPPGPYYMSILNSVTLRPEHQFLNTNTESCYYQNNGNLKCKSDHPGGFEWCINAPAVDANGVIYANSEDGNLYVINPDGSLKQHLFLKLALGAAYTPLAIGGDGKVYTENDGHLFVIGK